MEAYQVFGIDADAHHKRLIVVERIYVVGSLAGAPRHVGDGALALGTATVVAEVRELSPIELGILEDLGYTVAPH